MANGIFYRFSVQHIRLDTGFLALEYIFGFIVSLGTGALGTDFWAKMPKRTPPPPVF